MVQSSTIWDHCSWAEGRRGSAPGSAPGSMLAYGTRTKSRYGLNQERAGKFGIMRQYACLSSTREETTGRDNNSTHHSKLRRGLLHLHHPLRRGLPLGCPSACAVPRAQEGARVRSHRTSRGSLKIVVCPLVDAIVATGCLDDGDLQAVSRRGASGSGSFRLSQSWPLVVCSGRETCFVRRRNNSVPPIKTYLTSTTRRCSSPNCSCWDYSRNKSPIPQSISGNLLGHRPGGGGMEGGVSLSARGQFGINRVVGEIVPVPNTPRHSLLLTRHASHVHARCDREQSVYS